jgi:hypothetical protein
MSALVEPVSAGQKINHENYYSELTQGPHAYFDLGAFEFEMGETLPGAKLAYKTYGTLNRARDNAILFPHMYSGTSASMEPFIGVGRKRRLATPIGNIAEVAIRQPSARTWRSHSAYFFHSESL